MEYQHTCSNGFFFYLFFPIPLDFKSKIIFVLLRVGCPGHWRVRFEQAITNVFFFFVVINGIFLLYLMFQRNLQ